MDLIMLEGAAKIVKLSRVLEPEVMDSESDAADYDAMDHSHVNRVFVDDLLRVHPNPQRVLDVGTGTAQIPIELCQRCPTAHVLGLDLALSMIQLGRANVDRHCLGHRIDLRCEDAKIQDRAHDGAYDLVMSNSIVHHIPEPIDVFKAMTHACTWNGTIFVRDLLRPTDDATVVRLVALYADGANDHQRKLFDDSLRAALTLDEVRDLVKAIGFAAEGVTQTSDRHWTWHAVKR